PTSWPASSRASGSRPTLFPRQSPPRLSCLGKAENLIVVANRLPSSSCRQEIARLIATWLSIVGCLSVAFVLAACGRNQSHPGASPVATGTNAHDVRSDAARALLTQGDLPADWAIGDLRELEGRGSN